VEVIANKRGRPLAEAALKLDKLQQTQISTYKSKKK
jgi:hypothetical protein